MQWQTLKAPYAGTISEDARPHHITVYYDVIPPSDLIELRKLLMQNKVRIEFDYDRVGWSKTGFIYRVTRLL